MQYLEVRNWDFDERITPNFTIGEMVQSYTAYKNKVYAQYMYREDIAQNLHYLVGTVLQPLRDKLKAPIHINSGYRCKMLNGLVAGAENSLHMQGLAADISSRGLLDKMASILQGFRYHELIIYPTFIHVSIKQLWSAQRFVDKR